MIRQLLRNDLGTGAIEFGLVAPVLIFLLVGVVDMGRYLYCGILATHAATAGAQYGAQSLITADNTASMQAAALRDATALSSASATATPVCMLDTNTVSCSTNGATYYVQVKVTGTFHALINYPGIPSSISITQTATMRVTSQ